MWVESLRKAGAVAVRTLATSAAVLGGLAVAMSIAAYAIAGGGWRGGVAALLALTVGFVATGFGSVKRAIGHGARAAFSHAELGKRLVARLPEGVVSRAEAMSRIDDAVRDEAKEPVSGWLARGIRSLALKLAAAAIRSKLGGPNIDLGSLREGGVVDGLVLGKVDQAIRAATAIAIGLLAAGLVPAILLRVLS